MNTFDEKYLAMLEHVLTHGKTKKDRTGVGTVSVFGYDMRVDMSEGLSLLTTKYVHYPAVIHELLWFLMGGTDIKYLLDNNVNIWTAWPRRRYMETPIELIDEKWRVSDASGAFRHFDDKEYAEAIKNSPGFAEKHGRVGKVYGAQWTNWTWPRQLQDVSKLSLDNNETYVDGYNQIGKLVDDLKNNPDSRRMLVSAWNPPEMDESALPSCNYAFQCYTSELELPTREAIARERTGLTHDRLREDFVTWLGTFDYMISREHKFYDTLGIPSRSLSIKWINRSSDAFIGQPFDLASHSILAHMLCAQLNYVPGEMIMSTGDTHVYLNHLDQVKMQLSRKPYPNLPKLILNAGANNIFGYKYEDFKVEGYEHHSAIKAPIAV